MCKTGFNQLADWHEIDTFRAKFFMPVLMIASNDISIVAFINRRIRIHNRILREFLIMVGNNGYMIRDRNLRIRNHRR